MDLVEAERVQQAAVVVDDAVERPGELARHRGRRAEAPHVRAHHAVAARERRHPAVPGGAALGVAVQHQDRARLAPRIGVVVDQVVQVELGRDVERRHGPL
jgi:hypothetical protein